MTIKMEHADMYKVTFDACNVEPLKNIIFDDTYSSPVETVRLDQSHQALLVTDIDTLHRIVHALDLTRTLDIQNVTEPVPIREVESKITHDVYSLDMLNIDGKKVIHLYDKNKLGEFLNQEQVDALVEHVNNTDHTKP